MKYIQSTIIIFNLQTTIFFKLVANIVQLNYCDGVRGLACEGVFPVAAGLLGVGVVLVGVGVVLVGVVVLGFAALAVLVTALEVVLSEDRDLDIDGLADAAAVFGLLPVDGLLVASFVILAAALVSFTLTSLFRLIAATGSLFRLAPALAAVLALGLAAVALGFVLVTFLTGLRRGDSSSVASGTALLLGVP